MTVRIEVVQDILQANVDLANENRTRLDAAEVFSLNIMASPGAGKTTLIERTIERLAGRLRLAVIDGDIATSIDADRAAAAGAAAVQVNTGGECHLDANMIKCALDRVELARTDLLIVENVGNLVCPANFKLGTHRNVLVASVPEGHDKPYKYPGMYRGMDALVVNKIDLLPYVQFDMDYFLRGVEILNPGVAAFPLSCTTEEGLDRWIDWIIDSVEHYRQSRA